MERRDPRRPAGAALACLALALVSADRPTPPGWTLVWGDEFDGTAIDATRWAFETGNGFYDPDAKVWIGGWGNGELEDYTSRPENARVEGGLLHIVARKERHGGSDYTSARLKTRAKDGRPLFARTYGRFEVRARMPAGRGLWPAFWMLPAEESYGYWAASGEIDVVEARGQEPAKVEGTIHFGSRWPANAHAGRSYTLPRGRSIAEFHVYAVEWEPGAIRWYVDDHLYSTQTSWWSSGKHEGTRGVRPTAESDLNPWPAPFDRPFYLVLNLAVGGRFAGNPDATTPFPAEMVVDYVRVYEKAGGPGPLRPRGAENLPLAPR